MLTAGRRAGLSGGLQEARKKKRERIGLEEKGRAVCRERQCSVYVRWMCVGWSGRSPG